MENITEAIAGVANASETNGTATIPASKEGIFVAYASLFLMALGPIYFGSIRSLHALTKQKESGEELETITGRDAMKFPLIASCALFGIYIFFQIFSKEYINLLLTFYFFVIGTLAVATMINPFLSKFIPPSFGNSTYHLLMTEEEDSSTSTQSTPTGDDAASSHPKKELIKFSYQRKDLFGLAIALAIGIWYLVKKHWIANNLFGLAFSVNAVELLQLNKIATGCILLGGLFFYDIFWVFGTNVMVTVAKSLEAPIKLVFPRDIIASGLNANNFAMLGLGDIVVPGIFIALLLRFDNSLQKGSRFYFFSGFVAYVLGLFTTILIMHVFNHAQPALLYLVPSCLGIPLCLALIRGDIKKMFSYEDSPESESQKTAAEGQDKVSPPVAKKEQ